MAAIDRVLGLIKKQREDARQALIRRAERPLDELYVGDRRTRRIGGSGGSLGRSRPKRIRRSIGESIDTLLSGDDTQVTNRELGRIIEDITQALQEVANRRGILLFQGDDTNPDDDPNDAANEGENRAYQLYDNQLVYTGDRTRQGALYCHRPAIETETESQPEVFIPVQAQEDLSGFIEIPSVAVTYPLIPYAEYKTKITSLYVEVGASSGRIAINGTASIVVNNVTVSLNKSIGAVLDVAQELTLSTTDTGGASLSFTVGMIRI